MEASMQVSLSDSDVMRVAQAVADLLGPKLGARADLPAVMTLKDVMHHTGMGRTKVLGQIEAGNFPRPFERGGRGSRNCQILTGRNGPHIFPGSAKTTSADDLRR